MEEVVRLPGVKITGLRPLNYTFFYSTTISDILGLEERDSRQTPAFCLLWNQVTFQEKAQSGKWIKNSTQIVCYSGVF